MPSTGSAKLRAIAVQLKAEGDPLGMKLELTRALRAGAQPLIPLVDAAAVQQLPKHGGLNNQVAGQRVTVSVLTGANTAWVRLTTTRPDTRQTDHGYVRHPVFGRVGKPWVTQQIPASAGWWSNTLAGADAPVTAALLAVLERTAARIQAA